MSNLFDTRCKSEPNLLADLFGEIPTAVDTRCRFPASILAGVIDSPTPESVVAARTQAGLTQVMSARLVFVTPRTFQRWEAGDRAMPAAVWALFQIRLRTG